MVESEHVQAKELEELNLGTMEEAPSTVLITCQLPQPLGQELVAVLHSFQDVFVVGP